MTSAMERFEAYWSGGDPVARQRFLLRSSTPMLCIIISYILFVTLVGPSIMRKRKPVQMRSLIIAYNFGLVAFYLYLLLRGAYFFSQMGFSLVCGPLNSSSSPVIADMYALGYQLYTVRYIELMDTIFLVLSKKFKMVTWLHVFHHSIVPVLGWFAFRSESSGYFAVFAAVNGFIHVIMYSYYAIAALGPEYQKYIWWKKYLTSLQILQFLFITVYMTCMHAIGCTTSSPTLYFSNCLTVIFFFLFLNYYRRAYNNSPSPKVVSNKNGIHSLDASNGIPKNGLIMSQTNESEKSK